MHIRRGMVFATVIVAFFYCAPPVRAQLSGTDTVPGSTCAGFPTGSTRVTADADLNGQEVTLVCDGANWNPVTGPGGGSTIETVSGLAAPPYGPSCVQRTATTSTALIGVGCLVGEIMTGGGCRHTSTTLIVEDSGPLSTTSWQCEWSGASATGTAYAICCAF